MLGHYSLVRKQVLIINCNVRLKLITNPHYVTKNKMLMNYFPSHHDESYSMTTTCDMNRNVRETQVPLASMLPAVMGQVTTC